MKERESKVSKFNAMLSGVVIGLINGFFGGGGGMFCVPILEKVYKLNTKQSHSTALLVMLPLSIVSSVVYLLNNKIDYLSLGICGSMVVVGGIIGAYVLKRANSKWVQLAFAIIMLIAGLKMVLR